MKNLAYSVMLFILVACSKEQINDPGIISDNPASQLDESTGIWKKVADFPDPRLRGGIASFCIGNKGYVVGGVVNNENDFGRTITRDLWEFDPQYNTWTRKADFPDSARSSPVAFSINGRAYVGMGIARSGKLLKDFWEYDPSNDTWQRKADFKGHVRTEQASFAVNGKGYVGTGYCDPAQLGDFWEFDPAKNKWERKADFPGGARERATGLSIGNKGYLGFGFGSVSGYQNDFYEYNPATDVWTKKAVPENEPRISASAFTIGNNGYIGLGYFDNFYVGYRSDLWQYNSETNVWTKQTDFPGLARVNAASFSIAGKGYFGLGHGIGGLGDGRLYNDFWEFSKE